MLKKRGQLTVYFILGILKNANDNWGYFLIGLVSGFGQTFVLKVITIINKQNPTD